jgi:hypothetical protein
MGEPAAAPYVPEPGKVAIRDPDGSVWKIPQGNLADESAKGARLATEAEYFGAQHGRPGEILAAGAGFSRAATSGLSDLAYVEGARALGGDQDANDIRDTLRLLKQSSPGATLGGEIFGTGAQALAMGGGLSLGEAAVARVGAGALEGAAVGATSGMGAQLSEDTLENHKMVGEAYLSAGVKGGAVGLLLGGAGAALPLFGRGGARAVAHEAEAAEGGAYRTLGTRAEEAAEGGTRKSVLEHTEDLRDRFAYSATGATKKDIGKLGATAEEAAAEQQRLGAMLRKEVGISATDTEGEIAQRIIAKEKEVGAKFAPIYKEADTAFQGPSMPAVREGVEAIRAKHTGIYAAEELAAMEKAVTKLEGLGKNPTHTELWEASKAVYKQGKLNMDGGKEALRDLHGILRGELQTSVERAGGELGTNLGERLRLNNQLYADLKTASAAAKHGGKGGFGLQDATLLGPAVMTGHPAAVAAVGLNMVRRQYGNQIASHVLDTATRMETFQRAASKLDDLISAGSKAFASGSKAATRASKPVTTAEVRALREATRNPEAVTARVAEHLRDTPSVAPRVAQEIAMTATRAAAWLQHTLPKETPPSMPRFGKQREVPLSEEKLLEARAIIETVADGSIVVDRLREGRLNDLHVATLRFVHPETFLKIQKYLTQHATELNQTMTQQQLTRLGILFGEPLTEQDLPENRRAFQASFVQGNQAPGQGGAGGNVGSAAMSAGPVNVGGSSATANDKLEAGK